MRMGLEFRDGQSNPSDQNGNGDIPCNQRVSSSLVVVSDKLLEAIFQGKMSVKVGLEKGFITEELENMVLQYNHRTFERSHQQLS